MQQPPVAQQPPPPPGPRVFLRIDRSTARLQQQTMLGWTNICIPPCGAFVHPSGLYRVGGAGATVSEPFALPRASGDVFVDGHVGSKASRLVGLAFIIVGIITAGIGGLALINPSSPESDGVNRTAPDDGDRTGEYVTMGIGAGLATIGIALFALSKTSLEVH
jgi:hypothetical protein